VIKRITRTANGVTSTSFLCPATYSTNMIIPTQIIVKSNIKVLCFIYIRDDVKLKKESSNKCPLYIDATMDFAGFNIRRLVRDHSKILPRSLFNPPKYTLRAYPSAGCGKFASQQHTYVNSKILEHRS
jgi:hypothetical protein